MEYLGSHMHTLDLCRHNCIGNHHYGDQTVVRDECVLAYIDAHELEQRVAITAAHPAARVATVYWNHLTEAEMELAKELTHA